ncbi:hypothetical protein FSP39_001125 [Pinctada imbricata]|uniref:Small subunit processome component 20 homolog n=1 Tax=Pinctada imbricata TaxID=66713 RepID=A0AA89BW28_PINIB|nr:hypothetical protein FSP39_001125 [Pinctada imbricata]
MYLEYISPLYYRPLREEDTVVKKVADIINNLGKRITSPRSNIDKSDKDVFLCVLHQCLLSLIYLTNAETIFDLVQLDVVKKLLSCSASSSWALRFTDLYFTHSSNEGIGHNLTEDVLSQIYPLLENNITAPYSQVRKLTLRILSQFDVPLPAMQEDEEEKDRLDVFRICLEAELCPLTVHDFRTRRMFLGKLDFDIVQNSIPIGPYTMVPLRYLIGSLFINFKLIWEPVRELIAGHAQGLDKNVFWELWKSNLELAAEKSEEFLRPVDDTTEQLDVADDSTSHNLITDWMKSVEENDKPDFVNFRMQLWKSMQLFPEKCEPRSRDVVPIFFNFLSNEYYPADLQVAPTQDIRKNAALEEEEEDVVSEDEVEMDKTTQIPARATRSQTKKMEDQKTEEKKERKEKKQAKAREVVIPERSPKGKKQKGKKEKLMVSTPSVNEAKDKSKKRRRAATGALLVHLQLFSKYQNPKSQYRETELQELYYKLLVHKDSEVQKVAFECIMTYKHKYLIPYRENFERLLDDKTFKNEIVLFTIDKESSVIDPEHRADLLPVLMRILYGKMQHKTGTDTAGKNHSNVRRSIVMRFLNGCQGTELLIFLNMVFDPYKHFLQDNPLTMVQNIVNEVDITKVIPLRKITGTFHTINMVMKKLGHMLTDYLPSLLKIMLGLTSTCVACLEKRNLISKSALNTLKNLRQTAMARVVQFFQDFDSYGFTPHELDAVFEVCVWPQLTKLPFEGVYHPTPLLKLLHMFTTSKRYFSLLSKHQEADKSIAPMPFIIKLLNAPDANESVTSCITEMLDNLLSPEEESPEDVTMVQSLTIDSVLYKSTDCEEIAMCLVRDQVPGIFQYIKSYIEKLRGKMKDKKNNIHQRVLNILSRISEFVTDQDQCRTLIDLLLPYLGQGVKRSTEMEHGILNSIANLMSIVEERQSFHRTISSLFASLQNRQSRILLCKVFQVVTEKNKSLHEVAKLVEELNSWDPKRVEEPDYLRRLGAYRKINEIIRSMMEIDIDFLLPVIHNACYCVKKIDDMSLRDNSTNCLITVVTRFGHVTPDQDVMREIISQTLLPEVKAGMKDNCENVRHEFIAILAALVDTFPDSPMFHDLTYLQDKDPEGDFFENIRHIQTHRRSRAMKKMVKLLTNRSVSKEIIVSYFLPITSSFLVDDAYKKAQGLQDSAIETIGKICLHLPWPLYIHQLKYYLQLLPKRLDKQKLLVRVVVAIMDAFHFDLQKTEFVVTILPAMVTKQKARGMPVEVPENQNKEDIEENNTSPETDETKVSEDDIEVDIDLTMETETSKETNEEGSTPLEKTIKSDSEHKLAKSKYAEDTEILRVPIALAMVRLLQYLPQAALQQSLPGILLKVCNFLKSRAKDIRDAARDTLVKILSALGPKYFPYILSELRGALRKGYQVHVLCFTTFILLKNVTSLLKPGDLDVCRQSLQDVFQEDLFGQVSEEKEVESIASNLFEAKAVKSYDSYEILARFISRDSLLPLLAPLKEKLDSTHSHSISKKVQEALRRVGIGLMENEGLSTDVLMMFIHGLVSQTFPILKEEQKKKTENKEKDSDVPVRPPSCLLLPSEPKRGGDKPKASKKTNTHVIVEFDLQILQMLLKKSRLTGTDGGHLGMLDPFVGILAECLFSQHIKINTVSLRCLSWMLRFPLPSLGHHIKRLSKGMFAILKNYASAGAAKGDNMELVSMAFKAVTVLVRDVKVHTISTDQLQVLLTFCEEDLHDYNRQSTAFSLLRAILSRKLNVPEIQELMSKVENMAVTAESPHIQRECRQITLQYLLDYPLGKGLTKHIEFFISQLSYEMETGRMSALEMLASIFNNFPQDVLVRNAGLFFVPMSALLINDDSVKCRKLTALALKALLQKVDHNCRENLFSICVKWFSGKKTEIRCLAALTTGLFVEVEGEKFKHRCTAVLPLIQQQIEPGRYEHDSQDDGSEGSLDMLLYHCLNTFIKICRETTILRDAQRADDIDSILDHVQCHMVYAHSWVRLASAQIFGLMFSQWTAEEIADSIQPKSTSHFFLLKDPIKKMMEISKACITQLQSQYLTQELANQIIKNLVFIAKVTRHITQHADWSDPSQCNGMEGNTDQKKISVSWLVRKMIKEANHEAVSNTKVTLKRSSVFKWVAAVSLDLGQELLPSVVKFMLPPIQREINESNPNCDTDLKNLALEVLEILKKVLGVEMYTQYFTETQSRILNRKEERKRKRAVDMVAMPEIAIKRKLKKNLAKQQAKKRKAEGHRVAKAIKKRKVKVHSVDS